jgi:V/A-type H+-transporting ATPase subunit E
MATTTHSNIQTSGVQDLINRLHDEGVASGQSEAERLLAEARVRSMEMLDQAKSEAESIVNKARLEAESISNNGKEALRLASRDCILRIREACDDEFRNRLKRMVQHKLSDPKLLEKVILEIAAKVRPDSSQGRVQLLLSPASVSAEALEKEVAKVQPGSLTDFVLGLSADILREGLTFGVSDDPSPSVRIQLTQNDVQFELTDETITSLLMQYLIPRYRAVLKKDK